MRDFLIVGLTGPSGSGKSTVCKAFLDRGFSVINADEIAHSVLAEDKACALALCAAFGSDIAADGAVIDRKLLAERAFSSKENTQLLNDITHPAIFLRTLKTCRRLIDSGNRRIVFDAPVLFESHAEIMCDCTVCITAPENVRIDRLKMRDGLNENAVRKRLSAQHGDEYYTSRSDHCIDGGRPLEDVIRSVDSVIDIITNRFI